ncbi:hypothetical protein A4X13_0g3634 [Tilletia indica]|uniref:Uncharacterized protein n=1 Tax=Tilletia indica TaxID=43049 RepID=A0A177TN83_9BASI|nr:hypothetical protein A4X13_0g3634 [Tilletia indica]
MSSIPYEELPILEALINIRNRLTALKKDSSQYIRAQDVMQIYQQVIKQISRLNAVRDEASAASSSSSAASASASASASPAPLSASATATATAASDTPVSPLSPSISSALAGAGNNNNVFGNLSTRSSSNNIAASLGSAAGIQQTSSSSSSSVEALSSATAPTPSNPSYTNTQTTSASSNDSSPLTNRVDTTLNDVFALLSLFFLTIGKSRESPALFSQLSCMKQLLDHLAESGIYTETDLKPFADRLRELREIIIRDGEAGRSAVQLTKLMIRKLEGCERVLHDLQGTLSVLSVELLPIHQRLINVRRQIAAAAAKPKPARTEIKLLQEELRRIDSKRVDGKFLGPGGSSVPAGQAILVGILEECFEICHDITVRNDEVPMELQPIYDRLVEIKAQLEHLVLTHRWTLRETDLWNYQVSLKEIDRMRVDGKFVDSEGKQPEGQLVLLYLLRRCYGLIYRLVASSEPISEELMPISNKLSTVQKCLKEVSKYGGPFTMRDLYPYRLALHQIDSLRAVPSGEIGKDGQRKWLGRDGNVPEGQAILRAQYEEVEQTIEEMLNRQEDDDDEYEEEDEDEDDEDDGGEGEDGSGSDSEADGNTSMRVTGATSHRPLGSRVLTGGTGVGGSNGFPGSGAASGDDSALASPMLQLGSGFSTPGFAPIQPWGIQTFTSQGQQAAMAAATSNGLSRPPLKGAGPWSTFGSQASGISSSAGSMTGGTTSTSGGSNAGDAFQLSEAAISPTPTGGLGGSGVEGNGTIPPAAAAGSSTTSGLPQTDTVTASNASSSSGLPAGTGTGAGPGGAGPGQVILALGTSSDGSPTPIAQAFPPSAHQAAPTRMPAAYHAGYATTQPFVASVSPGRGLPTFFTTSQNLGVGAGTSEPGSLPSLGAAAVAASAQLTGSSTTSSSSAVSSTSDGSTTPASADGTADGAASFLSSMGTPQAASSAIAIMNAATSSPVPARGSEGFSNNNNESSGSKSGSTIEATRMMDSQRSTSERTLVPGAALDGIEMGLSSSAPAVADKADASAQTDAEPPSSSAVDELSGGLKDGVKLS